MRWTAVSSPVGDLVLAGDGAALHILAFTPFRVPARWRRDAAAFPEARRQLAEYFAGERTAFELELAPAGTEFQLRVWRALTQIPYGQTISYGELARRVGRPDAARAVGAANGRNPIAIVVPCHRVIGASGTLTGYGGGLDRKRALLDLERGQVPLLSTRWPGTDGQRTVRTVDASSASQEWSTPGPQTT